MTQPEMTLAGGTAATLAVGSVATLAAGAGWLAWRRRVPLLAVLAAGLLAVAVALAWAGRAGLPGPVLALPVAAAWLAAAWLVHRHVRALERARQRQAQLDARLAAAQAELQAVQHELQRAQAAGEAAEQSRARFIAAASHDLRQPAHALGLYLAALRAGPLAPAQAELAARMQGPLAALDTLFAALMDVSRIDAGAVVPQWEPVALAPLLRRLADEWALQAESRGLRLALHLADNQAATVSDALLLERVLRNLLANAVKYTQRGGVLLACRARRGPEGTRLWRIEVWDSGCGIAAAEQERVFEPFYQVGSGARREGPGGLGLGLAIVQRLARLLQLRVVLHSRPGRGSVFFVEGLAVAAAPDATGRAGWRSRAQALDGARVAVLEDDDEVRDAMRRLLQLWGCTVDDGADADVLLARCPAPPQALVADLRLADGREGPTEVRRLAQAWGTAVPVLWVSGETAAGGLRAQVPPGALLLTKPVSPARLRAWLDSALDRAADAPAPPAEA